MPTTNVRNQTPPCQSPLMSMSTTSVRNQTPPLSITFHVNVHYQCHKSDPILSIIFHVNVHFQCQKTDLIPSQSAFEPMSRLSIPFMPATLCASLVQHQLSKIPLLCAYCSILLAFCLAWFNVLQSCERPWLANKHINETNHSFYHHFCPIVQHHFYLTVQNNFFSVNSHSLT